MADQNDPPTPAQQVSQNGPQPEAPPPDRGWLETETLRASDPDRGIAFGDDHVYTPYEQRDRW